MKSGTHARTTTQVSPGAAAPSAAAPQRTDSRSLIERKVSVVARIAELREALRQAEATDAEISAAIEETERARERRGCARA